jgi:hypothetical protein
VEKAAEVGALEAAEAVTEALDLPGNSRIFPIARPRWLSLTQPIRG